MNFYVIALRHKTLLYKIIEVTFYYKHSESWQ